MRANWVMYCIVFCARGTAWMHNLSVRVTYLFVVAAATLAVVAFALKAKAARL